MTKTRGLRYALFILLFAVVLIGLVVHSYPLLVVAAIVAIALGVIGDKIENRPTEPYKQYNKLHHHDHGHKE